MNEVEIYGGENSALNFPCMERKTLSSGSLWWVCKHVWICLVCLGQCMSMNFTSIQFNTTPCRFGVPVLQPSSRQSAHLLKHNMYTLVRELGWSVGRGQPLLKTTCYKQSLPLKFYFHLIFSLNLWLWWQEKECLTLQKWQTTFCGVMIAMVWGGELIGEKKIPLENKYGACHITMQHWFTALQ